MNYHNIIRYLKDQKPKANRVADRVALLGVAFLILLGFFMVVSNIDRRGPMLDSQRLSDIKQLQVALELYYDSCGGYPVVPTATVIGSPGFDVAFHGGCPEGTSLKAFIDHLPMDPQPGGEPYRYCSAAVGSLECAPSGKSYVISFSLEKKNLNLSSGKHFVTPREGYDKS